MSDLPVIECEEYQTKIPSPNSDLGEYSRVKIDPTLMKLNITDDDKDLLRKSLRGIINIKELQDGLSITTYSSVGLVNFSSFSVVVRPKILMKPENLFGMINYAYNVQG